MRSLLRKSLVLAAAAGAASTVSGQTATMPPHSTNFTGATRGYWFTAPADFRITGIEALRAPGGTNAFMNWAVVRFNGAVPPPVFSATTNAFVQLGFGLNQPTGAYAPTSIDIFAGDVIGVYGNTSATAGTTTGLNSYTATGTTAMTTILGNLVSLTRSGMQFHLGSATSPAGMHDIWTELTSTAVTRVEFTYEPLGVVGACCRPDGTCLISSATTCTNIGGTYQGDGTDCATANCPQPPNGACCFADGTCTDVSTFACTAASGVWQGAGTACATANCPQPGACCFVDGTCSLLQPAACASQGGVFQGAGIACTAGLCPIVPPTSTPLGGLPVGTTMVNGTLAAGQVLWYSFTVPAVASPMYLDIDTEGSALAPANDTEIGLYTAIGALEDTDDDDGSGLLSQLSYGNTSARPAVGNSVLYNGRDGTLAAGTYYLAVVGFNSTFGTTRWNVVSPSTNTGSFQVKLVLGNDVPTGACCAPAGTCSIITQVACATATGVYRGDSTDCATANCPQPGACCAPNGTCSILQAAACATAGGIYRGDGTDCATANCPQPPTGACCASDGSCSILNTFQCTAAGGTYRGDGTDCASVVCPSCLTTSLANNGLGVNGGIFMDLTATNALTVEVFNFYSSLVAGSPVTVQVWTYPGSYVGHDTSNVGWVLHDTINGTSNGTATLAPLVLNSPLNIAQGQTVGVYLIGTLGGIRYTGATGSIPNWNDANLVLFSDRGRSAPWAGTLFTPRNYAGKICYTLSAAACYANCDSSTVQPVLTVADFGCFLNAFAAGDTYANCDASTTPPVLTVADFGCFLNAFAAGCS